MTGSGRPGAGRDLVIVGAGGFARETAQAVRAAAAADLAAGRPPRLRLLGHLDDDPALHGREVDGTPVLGGCERVRDLPDAQVVVCVGSPRDHAVRARLVRRLALPDERYATVTHPSAAVSESSSAGPGSVLLAHCALTAAVRLGAHVAVMPHAVLTHDDVAEDFVTIASGVRLGGGVRLARGCYVGAGALVREYVTVGAWSLIGMGAAVLGDVPPGEVWVGSPARRLRAAGPAESRELREQPERHASGEQNGPHDTGAGEPYGPGGRDSRGAGRGQSPVGVIGAGPEPATRRGSPAV
ncbi:MULTISPECIES: NeuD/PglB/VioB family sugar acetyltransferase [unclassified Streptomyces]|uniref:NeuD/PglB/VioB family sugar acetyltransferase n=1 Tax=unclassified Streptomyces TaxID=2593676 RepID=UPI002E2BCB8C|nr:NeuD/PglB/VioB family sugar acetyltransferase [Streptomyces sp. NBC_00223]